MNKIKVGPLLMKLLGLLVTVALFIVILFPFSDLTDYISSQVAKLSGGAVSYMQFDDFSLNPFGPKASFENILVETQMLPTIAADEIIFSPSLMALLQKKPMGKFQARGFLKGDLDIEIKGAPKSDRGNERQTINVNVQNLALKELSSLMTLPMEMKGTANFNATTVADFTFADQPESEYNLSANNVELLNIVLNLQGMPLVLPDLKLKQLELKGRLTGGKFYIDTGKLGAGQDGLQGSITGDMVLNLLPANGSIVPQYGPYNFNFDLKVTNDYLARLGPLTALIDAYKTVTPTGATFKFKASGSSFGMPPQMSALR